MDRRSLKTYPIKMKKNKERIDILIVKLGALGDVTNTLPLAVLLKEKLNAHITWLVAPLSLPLVRHHPCVDEVIVFDKKKAFLSGISAIKKMRCKEFDIVLDLQRILKSGFFALSAKAKRKIGFDKKRCKEFTYLLPFERIPASGKHAHMIMQYFEFAEYLGIKEKKIDWKIYPKKYSHFNLPESYIVLNIGASYPTKKWNEANFAKLANLIEKKLKIKSVLTGGSEDVYSAEKICALSKMQPIDLTGKTIVEELLFIINGAKAVVTCDTGPMHLSVALGTKTIALMGPTDFRRTGPFKGEIIQKNLNCSPCNQKTCDNPLCMKLIKPEDVLEYLL
jgi:ADP-heptose:LPS heptosyltransferase